MLPDDFEKRLSEDDKKKVEEIQKQFDGLGVDAKEAESAPLHQTPNDKTEYGAPHPDYRPKAEPKSNENAVDRALNANVTSQGIDQQEKENDHTR